MKKILTILFILTVSIQPLNAQNIKRANRLFEKSAFLNAAEIYLKENAKSQEILEKLGDCYYFNADMTNASKWYKVLMDEHYKNNTIDHIYTFRYVQTLKGINNFDEADKWFKLYSDSEPLTSNSNIKTVDFFKSLNQSIDRPYIIHKVSINSVNSDFGVFVKENKVLFASNQTGEEIYDWNNQPYLDLYEASIDKNGDLNNVTPLNSNINTKMHESNAIITKDGQTMYFSRNHYASEKKVKDKNKVTHINLYKASLVNGQWDNVAELPFNNPNYSMMHPALNFDESRLYFSSDMPGSIGSFDLFYVDINSNGTFGIPKNLGVKINTIHREQFPFVSSNHSLYFASDGHFGMGGLDIFRSKKTDGIYETVINLSDIVNSSKDDFAFVIDEVNETGYFSSNREGGIGDDDIYRFTKLKKYHVEGIAQNKNTLEILPGTLVSLLDHDGKNISEMTVDNTAKFLFEIATNSNYTLKGSLKTFNPVEINFKTDSEGNINQNILLMLESYEDIEENIVVENEKLQIKINPIYFDFDKWNIRKDAAEELNSVVETLKKYPEMVIEIGAHTDSRGNDKYNLVLSNKRGNSVRQYLIKNGISSKSVKSVGYGEAELLNNCSNNVDCSEQEHDINRRCEFVIVN